jgi:hypothetical protein
LIPGYAEVAQGREDGSVDERKIVLQAVLRVAVIFWRMSNSKVSLLAAEICQRN